MDYVSIARVSSAIRVIRVYIAIPSAIPSTNSFNKCTYGYGITDLHWVI
jgi:hypothetical protein